MENVQGILQARVLEWVAIPLSKGSSQPREWTRVSHVAGRLFTVWAPREALLEENIGVNLHSLGLTTSFFRYNSKSTNGQKEKRQIGIH